jgi:hypothetical protein
MELTGLSEVAASSLVNPKNHKEREIIDYLLSQKGTPENRTILSSISLYLGFHSVYDYYVGINSFGRITISEYPEQPEQNSTHFTKDMQENTIMMSIQNGIQNLKSELKKKWSECNGNI